jgi:acyl-CoA synthetase (AMP-forming)/AMP-acid ligase II
LKRLPLPATDTLVEALQARGRDRPDELAFTAPGGAFTFGALAAEARQAAAGLATRGIAAGDVCALVLPTGLDFVRTLFAAQWLGAVPVAFNPALPPALTAARVRRLGARGVVADGTSAAALAAEGVAALEPGQLAGASAGPPRPGPAAYVQLTSGSTGEPRGAVVGQAALMASLRVGHEWLELTAADAFAGWVPLHHDLGLVRFVFQPVLSGRPAHLVAPSLAHLRRWLERASEAGATITAAPDFVYRLAARVVDPIGLDLSRLRIATSGGEPVRASTIAAFESRFGLAGRVRPAYGLAEATLGVAVVAPGQPIRLDEAGRVSCGRALPGTTLRIVDEAGRDCGPGVAGEIRVSGATLFDGYLGAPEATAEALRDGWLHTGDVGALSADGELFVHGRRRALIKRAGALIAPAEVEEAVDAVAGVRLSAAVGVAIGDAEDLCVVAEVVEPAPAGLGRAIAEAVTARLGFAPARVLLVPPRTIPRTANGKLRHAELARAVAEDLPAR